MARKKNKFPAGRSFYDHRTESIVHAAALLAKAQRRLLTIIEEQQCPLPEQQWPKRIRAARREIDRAVEWLDGIESRSPGASDDE